MTVTPALQVLPHAILERRSVLRAGFYAGFCAGVHGVLGMAAVPSTARAVAAGDEPVRLLCSGPAGSIPDLICRSVSEQLSRTGGQHLVVDNRPGAAGQLSIGALMAAPADGKTLLLAQAAVATTYPFLYPKLGYDALADLAPAALAGEMTLALAVGPAVPAAVTSVGELCTWLKSNPALANVGSPGTGTLPHLLLAMLLRATGTPWQHIPYSGGPPALNALFGGQIAVLALPEGLLNQPRAAGRLRVLATSGPQRTVLMPDVPTLAAQGHSDLVVREWFAFFMSGKTAPDGVQAWSRKLRAVLALPPVVAQWRAIGIDTVYSEPAALAMRIAAEQRYWAPVVRQLGIRVE